MEGEFENVIIGGKSTEKHICIICDEVRILKKGREKTEERRQKREQKTENRGQRQMNWCITMHNS
jgi:hypothetical protein